MTTTDRSITTITGSWILFQRILAIYRNAPAVPAVMLAAPMGMMLLFGFVFGGALAGDQDAAAYRAFLTPGVLVLVAAMGLPATASTVNADLRSGLTDRIRAMPVPPIAVPAGIVLAELVTGALAFLLMGVVGYLAGWRIAGSATDVALAVLLLLAFRFTLSWLGVVLGAAIRDEQVLQQVAPLIFGTIMFSNVFVPTSTMPAGLAIIAEWNPVSSVVAALRHLFAGTPVDPGAAVPLSHPIAAAFLWIAALLAISIPAAVRRYTLTR